MTQVVENHEADPANDGALGIAQRQTGDDKGVTLEIHHIEHDRPTTLDHLAHLAVRDDLLDRLPDHRRRVGDMQAARVVIVHPDHIGAGIDNHHTGTDIGKMRQQRLVGQ